MGARGGIPPYSIPCVCWWGCGQGGTTTPHPVLHDPDHGCSSLKGRHCRWIRASGTPVQLPTSGDLACFLCPLLPPFPHAPSEAAVGFCPGVAPLCLVPCLIFLSLTHLRSGHKVRTGTIPPVLWPGHPRSFLFSYKKAEPRCVTGPEPSSSGPLETLLRAVVGSTFLVYWSLPPLLGVLGSAPPTSSQELMGNSRSVQQPLAGPGPGPLDQVDHGTDLGPGES